MTEIWVLSILLGLAIAAVFWIEGKRQNAIDDISYLKRQSHPCSIGDIEPGRYEIHGLYYYVRDAFGIGAILSANMGVMLIQKEGGIVRAVEFEKADYVGEAVLTSGIFIEVYREKDITKFKRLTHFTLS